MTAAGRIKTRLRAGSPTILMLALEADSWCEDFLETLSRNSQRVVELYTVIPTGGAELLLDEVDNFNDFFRKIPRWRLRYFCFPFHADHKSSEPFIHTDPRKRRKCYSAPSVLLRLKDLTQFDFCLPMVEAFFVQREKSCLIKKYKLFGGGGQRRRS